MNSGGRGGPPTVGAQKPTAEASAAERSIGEHRLSLVISPQTTLITLRPLALTDDIRTALGDQPPAGAPSIEIPWGPRNLSTRWLDDDDPPQPESLTNALGSIDDYLADVDRELHPKVAALTIEGDGVGAVARLESGIVDPGPVLAVDRRDVEEIFRLAATEATPQRAENPGLVSGDAELLISTLCIILATARRYRVATVQLVYSDP